PLQLHGAAPDPARSPAGRHRVRGQVAGAPGAAGQRPPQVAQGGARDPLTPAAGTAPRSLLSLPRAEVSLDPPAAGLPPQEGGCMAKYELPPLPYGYDALEPHIDVQTMQIHHTKHHQTYVDKLNAALAGHDDL